MSNNTKTCNKIYDPSFQKKFTEYEYGYYNETLYDNVKNKNIIEILNFYFLFY